MPIRNFPTPHIPPKLPITNVTNYFLSNKTFIQSAINGDSSLSRFIGYLQNIPNPTILISALTMQEAVLSSKIEGTIATIEDVLNNTPSTDIIKNDIKEIENYITAIQYAFAEFKEKDISITKNMICALHKVLLSDNVRGASKAPGQFKTEQNYIANDILGNFTPLPPYLTNEYIENLVNYINTADEITNLIAIAIIHAQFEMIHPFKDGNGRVGRLLIPLYLFIKGSIPYPVFYISRYFAANDNKYKECLHNISQSDIDSSNYYQAWGEWITFFLYGVEVESKLHIQSAQNIISLYKEMIEHVKKTEHIQIIDFIFNKLRVTPKDIIHSTELNRNAVYDTLNLLTDLGYLSKIGSPRKSIFIFTKLVDVLE